MNGERLCLPLQVTLKLERTAFHSANMCCGQYWDDGEPEFLDVGVPVDKRCVAPANEAIIVQTKNYDQLVHMVVTNLTTYHPQYPQYHEDGTVDHSQESWLGNGQKDEHRISEGLIQLNQCNERSLDALICFVEVDHKAIFMHDVRIRLFDFDMGKYRKTKKRGPEAVQFSCPGGFFEVYGDSPPYISWPAGKPVSVTRNGTYNGLTVHRYKCPDIHPVTMWARLDGTHADNPTTPDLSSLTAGQEMRMVLIEFKESQCVPMTFASMPARYRQVEEGWPLTDASNGGNPLNGTRKLDYAHFEDLKDEPCEWHGSGRNIQLSGYFDQSDVRMCAHPPPAASPPPPAPAAAPTAAPTAAPDAAPCNATADAAPTTSPAAAATSAPAPSMPAPNNPAASSTAPLTFPVCKNGSRTNVVKTNAKGVGEWGGSCTCPDGSEYPAGELVSISSCMGVQHLGLLACYGGKPGKINRFGGDWSGNKVDCHVCDDCEGPYQNVFSQANDWHSNVGAWGGECTCPDGQVYLVGDRMDSTSSAGGTLACEGGTPGAINRERGPWSGNSVICSSCPGPQPLPSPCEGKIHNVVTNNDTKVGAFGGECTCPDGKVYQVGDVYLGAEPTLACFGGTPGAYHARPGPWSHSKVQCGACDVCGGPAANLYDENDPSAGGWGGQCACPDGQVYEVGDNHDSIQSLKCVGGVWNVKDLNTFEGVWSRKSVVCSPCPVGGDTSHLTELEASHKGGAGPSR